MVRRLSRMQFVFFIVIVGLVIFTIHRLRDLHGMKHRMVENSNPWMSQWRKKFGDQLHHLGPMIDEVVHRNEVAEGEDLGGNVPSTRKLQSQEQLLLFGVRHPSQHKRRTLSPLDASHEKLRDDPGKLTRKIRTTKRKEKVNPVDAGQGEELGKVRSVLQLIFDDFSDLTRTFPEKWHIHQPGDRSGKLKIQEERGGASISVLCVSQGRHRAPKGGVWAGAKRTPSASPPYPSYSDDCIHLFTDAKLDVGNAGNYYFSLAASEVIFPHLDHEKHEMKKGNNEPQGNAIVDDGAAGGQAVAQEDITGFEAIASDISLRNTIKTQGDEMKRRALKNLVGGEGGRKYPSAKELNERRRGGQSNEMQKSHDGKNKKEMMDEDLCPERFASSLTNMEELMKFPRPKGFTSGMLVTDVKAISRALQSLLLPSSTSNLGQNADDEAEIGFPYGAGDLVTSEGEGKKEGGGGPGVKNPEKAAANTKKEMFNNLFTSAVVTYIILGDHKEVFDDETSFEFLNELPNLLKETVQCSSVAFLEADEADGRKSAQQIGAVVLRVICNDLVEASHDVLHQKCGHYFGIAKEASADDVSGDHAAMLLSPPSNCNLFDKEDAKIKHIMKLGTKTAIYQGTYHQQPVVWKQFHVMQYDTFSSFQVMMKSPIRYPLINYPELACLDKRDNVFQAQPFLENTLNLKKFMAGTTQKKKGNKKGASGQKSNKLTMNWRHRIQIAYQIFCIFEFLHTQHPAGVFTFDDNHPEQYVIEMGERVPAIFVKDKQNKKKENAKKEKGNVEDEFSFAYVRLLDIDTMQLAERRRKDGDNESTPSQQEKGLMQNFKNYKTKCRCFYCHGRSNCIFVNTPEGYQSCGQLGGGEAGGNLNHENLKVIVPGRNCDASSDVWFLGQLLLYLLQQKTLWTSQGMGEMQRHFQKIEEVRKNKEEGKVSHHLHVDDDVEKIKKMTGLNLLHSSKKLQKNDGGNEEEEDPMYDAQYDALMLDMFLFRPNIGAILPRMENLCVKYSCGIEKCPSPYQADFGYRDV